MQPDKSIPSPPRWATRLLRWYCAPHLWEEIQGDLHEEFYYQVKQAGYNKARIDYILNVIGFIKPFAIKRKKSFTPTSLITMTMFRHYTLVALRNIIREKSFSGINITGLALGITCCLFIFLWVRDEQAIDNFHVHGEHLYSLYQTVSKNGQTTGSYSTPLALVYERLNVAKRDEVTAITPQDIRAAIPDVKNICSYATGYELPWGHPETFQAGTKIQKFEGSRAGQSFFTMLSYPIIAGDSTAALHDISSIAISRKMAEYFFDTPRNAIGKSIRYEDRIDFIVNAVFDNVSAQSSLTFDFLINWQSQLKQLDWASPVVLTTVQLESSADPARVAVKLNRFLQSRLDKNDPTKVSIGLRPYHEKYLYSTFVNGKPREGRIAYIKIFSGVALFLLIIACINFMNLATAKSVKRAKEVGVRKVIGSSRAHLIGQFLGESMLLSFFALLVSVVLIQLLLPAFNTLTGKHITSPLALPDYWLTMLVIVLFTGILAGSYPALYLSSLRPARTLKGIVRFTSGSIWFRKGLVCFQFALSIALLIATLVVSNQTDYVQTKNLGYDRDNVIYMQIEGALNAKYALFKERAQKMPGIVMVDRSSEAPHAMGFIVDDNDGFTETGNADDAINWEGKEKHTSVGFKPTSVGFDFVKLMNLKIAEGRDFSKAYATDSADAFMVNEEAVKQMGMENPIGRWISAWNKKGHIIGVLKDYHTNTLREPIKPLIVDVKEYEYFGVIIIRIAPGETKQALSSLERLSREINPTYPFVFQFLDQEYDKLYRHEKVITKLVNIFAALGIVISCLGLLGLVILAAEQRTKEISIRKVLGATVANIVHLLSKEFLSLVAISFVIAAPVAGYFMHAWLQGFAYKIELSWWIFAVAGLTTVVIALATVSIQALHSALANPVKSLRAE